MKNIIKIGILVLPILFIQNVNAQNIGNLLKKATEKIEEKSNEEAEKAINKKIDELFEDNKDEEETTPNEETEIQAEQEENVEVEEKQTKSESQQNQAILNMMGMGVEIPTEDSYNFTSSITMEMESFNSDGNSDGKIFYESYINPNEKTYAMKFTSTEAEEQNSEGLMVFDYKNKAMIILSNEDGEKSGMVTPIAADESVYDEDVNTEYDEDFEKYSNIKKTGNSKKILGYNCDEYMYKDEQGKISYWFTDEVDIFNSSLFGGIEQLSMFFAGQMPEGMMLQMESEDFNSNEKFQLNVKEINKNRSKSISLEGYQLVSIGGM
jgi:Domain of unknown function (DUF4412)